MSLDSVMSRYALHFRHDNHKGLLSYFRADVVCRGDLFRVPTSFAHYYPRFLSARCLGCNIEIRESGKLRAYNHFQSLYVNDKFAQTRAGVCAMQLSSSRYLFHNLTSVTGISYFDYFETNPPPPLLSPRTSMQILSAAVAGNQIGICGANLTIPCSTCAGLALPQFPPS